MSARGRRPRVAVVIFPGSNCDRDTLAAVEDVGGEAVPVWHQDLDLAGCGAVILPGGFSYGDYLRAGAMAARSPVMGAVRRHAECELVDRRFQHRRHAPTSPSGSPSGVVLSLLTSMTQGPRSLVRS